MAKFFKILDGDDSGLVINIDQIAFFSPSELWLRVFDQLIELSKNDMNRLLRQTEITPTPFID